MDDTLLVTVAPYSTVTISPHPSGVPGMPPLRLSGGDTLRVTRQKAEDLYQRRQILHPFTGKVRPESPPPAFTGPTVSVGGRHGLTGMEAASAMAAAERDAGQAYLERKNAEIEERNKGVRPWDAGVHDMRAGDLSMRRERDPFGAFTPGFAHEIPHLQED